MPNWYDEGYERMMQYILDSCAGLTREQVRDVYAVMSEIGLIDYDTEKEVIWDQFYEAEDEDA